MTRANAAYAQALLTPPRTTRTHRTRARGRTASPVAPEPEDSSRDLDPRSTPAITPILLTPPRTIRTYAGRARRVFQAQERINLNATGPRFNAELPGSSKIDAMDSATVREVYAILSQFSLNLPAPASAQ